ncbi:MAG: EAL domain-containing protein [Nitrospirota bacterium]
MKHRDYFVVALLLLGIFAADMLTPLGSAVWLLYLFPLFLVSRVGQRLQLVLFLLLSTALTIVGLFASPPGITSAIGTLNRIGFLFVLWTMSFLFWRIRAAESALEDVNRELQESGHELLSVQERFSIATEAARIGIHDYDVASGAIRWDRRVRELWGVGPDEPVTYEMFIAGLHPDDRVSTQAAVDKALDPRGDGRYHAEYRVINRKDGITHWVEAAGQVFFADGRAVRLVGTVEDITERKRIEDALRQSEERFRKVFEEGPLGIGLVGADYRFSKVNGRFCQMVGFSEEELKARTPFDITHPDDIEKDTELASRLYEGSIPYFSMDKRYIRKDGGIIWVILTASLIRADDGTPLYFLGMIEDITERKRSEEQLRRSKELSDALNRINAAIHSTLDIDTIMRRVVVEAAAALNADASSIGLFQDDYFVVKYGYNVPDGLIGQRVPSKEIKGVHYAASVRDVVAFDSALDDERLNVELLQRLGARSLMVVPFIARGTVFGALSFYCLASQCSFSDMHIDFGRKLSASLSLVLEDARLFAEVKAAQEHASFFADALENSSQPFASICPDGTFMIFNKAFVDLTGYSTEELRSMTMMDLTPPEWHGHEARILEELHRTGQPQLFQKEYIRKDGTRIPLELKVHQVTDERGDVLYHYAFITDITDRRRREEEVRHMAHHDALTGLPNRRLFADILGLELAKARRSQGRFAVLFLDLDRFKYINDTLGHDIGDELLNMVAERLRGSVRESDIVSRMGGDEFNILLADIAHPEDIITVARKIIDSFREPFAVKKHTLHISTSIGISICPDDALDSESLFKNADIAMYHAKELGGSTYQFYDAAMNIRTVERMRLESWLRQALIRGELEVYYQPQITTDTRQVVCAEALVRWRHPEKGLLDPEHFIPLAEETGFISAIDEWVLRTACAQVREWQETGLPPLCVTVNLSAKQFQKADLVERVTRILEETGLDPVHLDLEITESVAMKNLEHTVPTMTRLSAMGVGIAIDDFGTGYSSLNYLKKLPIHKLKIDRSFVRDIAADSDDRTIVKAVTALAHNMKLRVIAEGVETEEQLEFLKSVGCQEMQGYLFSRPLPAKELGELIAEGR